MERQFNKLQDFIDAFTDAYTDMLAKYEKYVKDNIDETDFAVKNQKTLLYKWYCGKRWGHCFPKNADSGICLRCGKKVLPAK
jgi:hypothetical protein